MKKWITGTAVAVVLSALIAVDRMVLPASAQAPGLPVAAQAPGFLTLEGAGSVIGVTVRETTADDAKAAKLAAPAGVVIESVRAGSPAEKSGLRSGDLVLEFDGERVRSAQHFTRLVRETPPGRTVSAVVLRDGARQTLQVSPEVTGEFGDQFRRRVRPEAPFRVRPEILRDFNFDVGPGNLRRGPFAVRPSLGVTVTPLSGQLAEYFGVTQGALVASVASGSPAADAGLKAGDVITAIQGRNVTSAQELTQALRSAEPGSGIDLSVTRDRKSLTMKVTLPAPNRPAVSGGGGLPI